MHSSFVLIAALLTLPLFAQERAAAPRPDGAETPMLVYAPSAVRPGQCAPLALISHGAGGSEDGYSYLAEALSGRGFTAIVMGHRESGLGALGAEIHGEGFSHGVRALVADPNAEQARLLDVSAALKWADARCRAPFRVLLGHSMGAETVMLEAGARNMIDVASPPAGQDRFDAYVALSPEGPGLVFPAHAWRSIRKPMLVLTGTRDQSLTGAPQTRQIPWHDLPADAPRRCHWLAVIDRAIHMNFAGNGIGADRVESLVTQTIAGFLTGVRAGNCVAPDAIPGLDLRMK